MELQIKDVEEQLMLKGITMDITTGAKDWLGEKGYDPVFGARPLRRVIQDEIEDRLSDALLESRFEAGDRVLIDVQKPKQLCSGKPALSSTYRDDCPLARLFIADLYRERRQSHHPNVLCQFLTRDFAVTIPIGSVRKFLCTARLRNQAGLC